MRIITVGNGLAGTIFSKTVRDLDSQVQIDIFAKEKYLYYPRPNLIEFLAGNLPYDRLFAFKEGWFSDNNINLHLGLTIEGIETQTKEVTLSTGEKEKYDLLLLADGAHSFLPPIQGAEKNGVFTLRTLDDVLELLDYLKDRQKVVIIGGGLLGLEIARAVKTLGKDVEIVEFFPRLLPRQLDVQGAEMLKGQIEKMGMGVRLGLTTEEILGATELNGLQFKGGDTLEAEAAIVAAGVRPNLQLANDAGLEVDRGIIVDKSLRTSQDDIFAAGDNTQHEGRVYGIIPAAFEQAKTAAANALGQKVIYQGTLPSNTLKVVGIDVTSIGLVNPEDEDVEEIGYQSEEQGIYKKIVLQEGRVLGAIWMGTRRGVKEINQIIAQKINVDKWKDSLLDEDFDFTLI